MWNLKKCNYYRQPGIPQSRVKELRAHQPQGVQAASSLSPGVLSGELTEMELLAGPSSDLPVEGRGQGAMCHMV